MLYQKTSNSTLFGALLFVSTICFADSAYEQASDAAWELTIKAEDGGKQFLDQRRKASESAETFKQSILGDSGRSDVILESALQIGDETRTELQQLMGQDVEANRQTAIQKMLAPGKTYIFVSQSMPDHLLANLYRRYESEDSPKGVSIVFRGLNNDQQNIPQMMRAVTKFAIERGLKPNVHVGINDTVFREYDVTSVPQIIHILPDGKPARVKGLINVDYFLAELQDSENYDLGVLGETYPISERPLRDIIKERLARIDWEAKKRQAVDSFWSNHTYQYLPSALEPETLYADMRVFVNKDVPDGKGGFIARKGELLDPFNSGQAQFFNRRIIVFNPNSPAQVAWAKNEVRIALHQNQKPVPMLSEIYDNKDPQTLYKIEQELRTQVFLLVPEVVERFALTKLPVSIQRSKIHTSSMLLQVHHCDNNLMVCKSNPLPQGEGYDSSH